MALFSPLSLLSSAALLFLLCLAGLAASASVLPEGDYELNFFCPACMQQYRYITNPSILQHGGAFYLAARALKVDFVPNDIWHSDMILAKIDSWDKFVETLTYKHKTASSHNWGKRGKIRQGTHIPCSCLSFFSPHSAWRNNTCLMPGTSPAFGPEDPRLFLFHDKIHVMIAARPQQQQAGGFIDTEDPSLTQLRARHQAASEASQSPPASAATAPARQGTVSPGLELELEKTLITRLPSTKYCKSDNAIVSQFYFALDEKNPTNPHQSITPIPVVFDLNSEKPRKRRVDKNFSPFDHSGQLVVSAEYDAHFLLLLDPPAAGKASQTYYSRSNTFTSLRAKLGKQQVRGNSPPILVDLRKLYPEQYKKAVQSADNDPGSSSSNSSRLLRDHPQVYLGVVHLQYPPGHYVHYLFTFATSPPFTTLSVSPCPLPMVVQKAFHGHRAGVAFVAGLTLHDRTLLVSYGSGDSESRVLAIDIDRMKPFPHQAAEAAPAGNGDAGKTKCP